MTSQAAADNFLIPPSRALKALGLPMPTYNTWRQRGLLDGFFGDPNAIGYSRFTLCGFLALAAYRAVSELKIEIREMPPAAFLQFADMWLRTRGTDKPVREAVLRWYGRPSADDSKFSRAVNEDALMTQPAPGARVTIRLDLDVIFGEAEHALLHEPTPRRRPEEIFGLGLDDE